MSVRPPVPDDVPTDGESEQFHGTNPWAGPFFVIAIGGSVLLVVLAIVIAMVVVGLRSGA